MNGVLEYTYSVATADAGHLQRMATDDREKAIRRACSLPAHRRACVMRAPIVRRPDGSAYWAERPTLWSEELDWKAVRALRERRAAERGAA